MRIVFLNPSGQMGGAEVALLDILASLKAARSDWQLDLLVSDAGPLAAKARSLGVATTVLPFPTSLARIGDAASGGPAGNGTGRLRLLSRLLLANGDIRDYVERLRVVLREFNPDVIHSNGFKMHILGALAKPAGTPLVWHIHDYVSDRPLMTRLLRRFRKRCAFALANSNSVKSDIEAVCGDRLTVRTIHNGIDTAVFSPGGAVLDLDALANLTPAAPGTIRVGMLATFARWKGHETFLTAMSSVLGSLAGMPVRGYVIGDGLYRTEGSQTSSDELKDIAGRLGISDRIGFTGFVAEPASAMRSLDVVVHASTEREPFGLVIVEAMACGRAVILSEGGGAAELVETGTNALSHTPGNAAQLADCIKQLVTNQQLRAQLGAAGRITAERRFNRTRLADELIPIYEKLRGQKSEIRSQRSEVSL